MKRKWFMNYQCSHCYDKATHRRYFGKSGAEYFCDGCWNDEKEYHQRDEFAQYYYKNTDR